MAKLLLLDIDGTIIDTPHYEAWQWAARRLGMTAPSPREYAASIAGSPRAIGAERIVEINGGNEPRLTKLLAELKQERLLELSPDIKFFPDAERLLGRVLGTSTQVSFYTASLNAARFLENAFSQTSFSKFRVDLYIQVSTESRLKLIKRVSENWLSEHVVLVDGAKHSVEIAADLGMEAYQISREVLKLPGGSETVRVITSLDDLKI